MKIEQESTRIGEAGRSYEKISERLSPLIDVNVDRDRLKGFGVKLYDTIQSLDNFTFQVNRVTDEEQKKNMQNALKEEICKLGATVYNKIGSQKLPNTGDFYYVNIGGKKRRKSRRKKRRRKNLKKRTKRRR